MKTLNVLAAAAIGLAPFTACPSAHACALTDIACWTNQQNGRGNGIPADKNCMAPCMNGTSQDWGANQPPRPPLPLQVQDPPPVPSALSPLDVDCLKLERDLKALPPGADTAFEIASDVPLGMMELGALSICGIDAAAFNIRADAKGSKH
jgi:hypothetical protein